jgi:hypothetical protein
LAAVMFWFVRYWIPQCDALGVTRGKRREAREHWKNVQEILDHNRSDQSATLVAQARDLTARRIDEVRLDVEQAQTRDWPIDKNER